MANDAGETGPGNTKEVPPKPAPQVAPPKPEPDPFQDLYPLLDAEQGLLDHVKAGKVYDAEGGEIRPGFMRTLLLNAGRFPNAALGVGVRRCLVKGTIDVAGAKIDRLVSITESTIEGDFRCNYTEFKALFLDGTTLHTLKGVRCRVMASIYLRSLLVPDKKNPERIRRFHATAGVDVSGARIEGALSARGALIEAQDGTARYALNLADADIGSIILGPKDSAAEDALTCEDGYELDACQVRGGITFQRARCKSFTDSELIYTDCITGNNGKPLVLRGFQYESLGRLAPRGVAFRKKWLSADADRDEEFDPQPFEQLAKVLRAHGETTAAQEILILKERKQIWTVPYVPPGRSGFYWLLAPVKFLYRCVKSALMEPIGYGYRTSQLLVIIAALIFFGGLVFNHAFRSGQLAPSNALVARSQAWAECYAQAEARDHPLGLNLTSVSPIETCKKAPFGDDASEGARALYFYPDFSGYWYALDVFLPILSLQQEQYWVAPDQASGVRVFAHVYTLLGWLLSSLGIVGALGYLNRV